jgi:hypothetical protein
MVAGLLAHLLETLKIPTLGLLAGLAAKTALAKYRSFTSIHVPTSGEHITLPRRAPRNQTTIGFEAKPTGTG